ncbi:hypothetical protein CEUSTIGMA_g8642.t1 [Chlamydomonas eustigma]|uniref:Serpin domain-containing protein n=1 Tax=Chlamydomonas eustigma TaxID=1157962 RepID=A0A250XEK6_9CHLO|nr:hypothetical protein CEUSTIGMA_g8642.t1 [Chlamydomonas eustigma]|eukprot:GAX81210.1 hypothetical protein CEUSTIGMA_g8642.t1 [Chlamydomonas eustigma]
MPQLRNITSKYTVLLVLLIPCEISVKISGKELSCIGGLETRNQRNISACIASPVCKTGLYVQGFGLHLLTTVLKTSAASPADNNNTKSSGAFLSPLSIFYALTLAVNAAGVNSTTENQILTLLSGCPVSAGEKTLDLSSLNNMLFRFSSSWTPYSLPVGIILPNVSISASKFALANGIFTYKSNPKPSYISKMKRLFKAQVEAVQGAAEVNAWIDNATNGLIPTLLPETASFNVALVNALYFKGNWSQKFNPAETQVSPFAAPGGSVNVDMMSKTYYGAVISSVPGVYDSITLDYSGPWGFTASFYLPATNSTPLFDVLMSIANKTEVVTSQPATTSLLLPKFKISTQMDLGSVLKSMGMTDAFDPNLANFSRLIRQTPTFITSVLHEAVVSINESGTEAAAATAVEIMTTSVYGGPTSYQLSFNRPFVMTLDMAQGSVPLFVGVVDSPTAASSST